MLFTAAPMYWLTAFPVYWFTAVPIYGFTAVPIHWFTAVPIYVFTAVPIHSFTAVPIYWFYNALIHSSLCRSLPPLDEQIQNYLLEKTRIVAQAKRERSYHIFYQLLAGASSPVVKELNLEQGVAGFQCLKGSQVKDNDASDFEVML